MGCAKFPLTHEVLLVLLKHEPLAGHWHSQMDCVRPTPSLITPESLLSTCVWREGGLCQPGHGGRTRGALCPPHAMHRQRRAGIKLAACWSSASEAGWTVISHAASAGCSCPGPLHALRTPRPSLAPSLEGAPGCTLEAAPWMLSPPPLSARRVCSPVAV